MEQPRRQQGGPVIAAWLIHAFSASGAILALLALEAIGRGELRLALLWLGIALAVDGVDGTLARRFRVKERAARIDGAVLDLVIDYLNYVFVPTIFIWQAGLVPAALAVPLGALIQLSSLYVFARSDMKTEDNYFRGFPALWNVVALYLYVAAPGATAGAIIVFALALSSFAPIHFVHPFRVRDYGPWLPLLTLTWAGATAALLWPGWSDGAAAAWFWSSTASAAMLLILGLVRTARGSGRRERERRPPKRPPSR
ncbi:phosphatidylcholine/phosphatidylserine synthase [Sphingosinicella sp. CPCC 101087]|uniref:CDP-alcohol phosphatidyltransferase family protein n=1 Tax=Sphingosinicella sp. CPCC 101087 TaxID=2497754 RepID=UPI00101B7EEF|nr:CDP-alcohol phosphatidyltransferase family protein [Sphingosinicella sp. CPCC 101087]